MVGSSLNLANLYLQAASLAKDQAISVNSHALLKEIMLRRDVRLMLLMQNYSQSLPDRAFVDGIHKLIQDEAHVLYAELFAQCPLEVAKSLSKAEREVNNLDNSKSLIYGEIEFQCVLKKRTLSNLLILIP